MKLVIAALPLVLALAGLSVLLIQDGRGQIRRAQLSADVSAAWEPLLVGLEAVDAERRAVSDPANGLADDHRRSTNSAMVDIEQALLLVAEESAALEQLGRALASLGAARTSVIEEGSGLAAPKYAAVTSQLVGVGRLLLVEAEASGNGRVHASTAAVVETEQSARNLVALAEHLVTAPVDRAAPAAFAAEASRTSAAHEHAVTLADDELRTALGAIGFTEALDAGLGANAELQARLLAGDGGATIDPTAIEPLGAAVEGLATIRSDVVADLVESSRSDARVLALLTWARVAATVLAIGVAVGLAVVVSRSITRRVRAVSGAAQQVTVGQLPVLVEALRDPRGQTALPTVQPIDDHGSDEVSELARSFNQMQTTLGEVAREQLDVLQRGVSDLFVTMARRNRSLVDRQLALLDELEARENDPATLEHFYRLDHLATRMRRHAESLLVLADSDSRTRLKGSASVDDIVRAAVSEVEDYQRIDVLNLEHLQIRGVGVADLTHLLAELLENATAFSPPTSRVRVTGDVTDGHYRILIIDEGMGIPDARLDELNDLLAHPPVIGLSVEPTLGMSVVSLLAGAHGVSVELSAGSPGTIARIIVPRSLFERRHSDRPEPDLPPVSVRPELSVPLGPPEVEPVRSEPPVEAPVEVADARPDRQTRAATRKARRSKRRSGHTPAADAPTTTSRRSRRHGRRRTEVESPAPVEQHEEVAEAPLALRLSDLVTAPSPTDPPAIDESPSAELAVLAQSRDDVDQPHRGDELGFDVGSAFDQRRSSTDGQVGSSDDDDPFEEFVPSVQPLPTPPEPLPRRQRSNGDKPVDPFEQSADDLGLLADLDVTPSWARQDELPRRPLDTPPAPTRLPAPPPASLAPPPGATAPPLSPPTSLVPPPPAKPAAPSRSASHVPTPSPAPFTPPPPSAPFTPPRSSPVPPPPPPGGSLPGRAAWTPAAPPPTDDDRIVTGGGTPADLKAALVAFDLGRRSAGRSGDVHGGQS